MPNARLPAFYDDLEASHDEAWRCLKEGAGNRRSGFHTPALATVRPDGTPSVRTVVLRETDPVRRTLRFHTDHRGRKTAEIDFCPRVMLHFYAPAEKLQLRVEGLARLHAGDAAADTAWAGSQISSRQCYRIEPAPGAPLAAPGAYATDTGDGADAGRENFSAIIVSVDRIEWLYLAARGHRRAEFAWNTDTLTARWLAP